MFRLFLFMLCTWCTLISGAVARAAETPAFEVIASEDAKAKDPKKIEWSWGVGYNLSSDLADTYSPRIFNHSLSLSAGADFYNQFSASASFGGQYTSAGGMIQNDYESFDFADLNLGVSKDWKLGKKWGAEHLVEVSVSNTVPISREARALGYYAVPGADILLTSKFFGGKYVLSNTVSANLTLNRYEFSPTDLSHTQSYSFGYSLGNSFRLVKGLKFGISFGVHKSGYSDSFSDVTANNTESVSYSYKSLTASLSYSNGGFTDDDKAKLWYIDQYRRLFSLGLSYEF